ncbi:hypothetical protein BZARG_1436 [Bizionia argentinensis JUB59]|uniref:TonB-dependent receptor n=1 Tax=Bizionia argentinensis JUB59 TaxID=1046627 RepID=G2EC12_9FLAO|nr:TonB-dependent receptor [Bizionia argentinensis]EGV43957.1 hypothetical protein BZARG_1436 [Bizionia argentinensis JUB59]
MVFFFFCINYTHAQHNLSGTITDAETKEPVKFVSIIIKDNNNTILSYTSTDIQGFYKINIPENHTEFFVTTSMLGYFPKTITYKLDTKSAPKYTLNIAVSQRTSSLDEVLIETKKPILVKKDTTVYRPNQFKDGSERHIEDLLSKLPGITIADNGSIRFKGKQVTRVLLDNDNLFDANYTIGTRNINPEIIEEIEAIEDYQKNPLLKGIENTEDVALNLILKKGKTDVSGEVDVGLGIKDKYDLKSSMISVSKKIKGFGLINYNNINQNQSPYNFSSNTFDLSKANELELRADNFLNSNNLNSIIPENYIGENKNLFGSINALSKISENTSIRINYNHLSDRLILQDFNKIDYNLSSNNLIITNASNQIKKPNVNVLDYEIINSLKPNQLLNLKGKLDYTIVESRLLTTNNNQVFNEVKKSEDFFLNQELNFTNKIDKNKAFQVLSNFSSNNIPQNFNLTNPTDENTIQQQIKFKKNTFNIQSKFLSKVKSSSYAASLGFYNHKSTLESSNNVFFTGYSNFNNTLKNDNSLYLDVNYEFSKNKWMFSLENRLLFSYIKITDNASIYKDKTIIYNPSFKSRYLINNVSSVYINFNINNQAPEIAKKHSGLIQTNNRYLQANNFNYNLIKNENLSLGYRINDFYNLFQFNSYVNFSKRNFDYLNNMFISEENTINISSIQELNNTSYRFGIDTEKYIHFFKSTFNLKTSYTINNYKNSINNEGLRDNINKSLFLNLDVRTGFKENLNFENSIIFQNNTFASSTNKKSTFTTFQNNFTTKYKQDNFWIHLDTKYFNPDVSTKSKGVFFADIMFNYVQKNKKIEYSLRVSNLFNTKSYIETNSSDLSTSTYSQKLLERYILISAKFKL